MKLNMKQVEMKLYIHLVVTILYDYVSRPYIFKDDTLVFETNKPGYNETVYFKVEWESEDEIFLYIESDNDKYSNEKYFIKID